MKIFFFISLIVALCPSKFIDNDRAITQKSITSTYESGFYNGKTPVRPELIATNNAELASTEYNMVGYDCRTGSTNFEYFNKDSYKKKDSIAEDGPNNTKTLKNSCVEDDEEIVNAGENLTHGINFFDSVSCSINPNEENKFKHVNNSKEGAYFQVGGIAAFFGEKVFEGTAFLEGPNLLVTAGHVVYRDPNDPNGNNPRFADLIYFFPGLDGDADEKYEYIEKVGRVNIEKDYYLNPKNDFQHDWAALELETNEAGYRSGWNGKISNWFAKSAPVSSCDYPNSKNGQMWETHGELTDLNARVYKTNLYCEEGQSGSPINMVNSDGYSYVCGILTHIETKNGVLVSSNGLMFDDFIFAYLNSFVTKHNVLYKAGTIEPSDYGYADAYPTNTADNFMQHDANGLLFQTRRYRAGYIQNEYVVMSPIRQEYREAFIEYKFEFPVYKIAVDLTYWRSISHEWLSKENGVAELQVWHDKFWWNPLDTSHWVCKFDLLKESTALPTDRTKPKTYNISFILPVTGFRFYCRYNGTMTSKDNNRGRICIGNMSVYRMAA